MSLAPLTNRAVELGLEVPPGWAVTGYAATEAFHPRENYFTDDEWMSFWMGDWRFATVTVVVTDEHDQRLFTQQLAHCEHGFYPHEGYVNCLDGHRPYMADLITQTVLGAHSYARARRMSEQ